MHCSFNFNYPRASVPATRVIKPGDELITTCTYNTVERSNVTTMGLGSQDEMCYAYVSYWPRLPNLLSACMSYAGEDGGPSTLAICGDESIAKRAPWEDPEKAVQQVSPPDSDASCA